MREFKQGTIVKHFKRETIKESVLKENPNIYLYEIIGTAKHTETGQDLMIYKPLYDTDCTGKSNYAARPLDMFESKVDKDKYPNIKQEYRFEEYKEGE